MCVKNLRVNMSLYDREKCIYALKVYAAAENFLSAEDKNTASRTYFLNTELTVFFLFKYEDHLGSHISQFNG